MKSQNGWTVQPNTTKLWNLPTVTGKVLAGAVWVVLNWLAGQFDGRVEPIKRGHSWGWAYRKITGSSKWSNHASGTAVDFNAVAHPQGRTGTFTAAQVKAITAIIKASDGVLRWGGTYPGRQVDDMHFEIAPGVKLAQVEKLATKILQRALITLGYDLGRGRDDGIRGPRTKAALLAFQRSHRLVADGIDGPLTWNAIYNEEI